MDVTGCPFLEDDEMIQNRLFRGGKLFEQTQGNLTAEFLGVGLLHSYPG